MDNGKRPQMEEADLTNPEILKYYFLLCKEIVPDNKKMGIQEFKYIIRNTERLYCISSNNRIYMSAFYIEGKVCNTSRCAIQVNKVGLKPTYPNTC